MAAMRLGNLKEASLTEILNGPRAMELRERLLAGNIQGLLCENCDKAGTCNPYGDPSFGQEGHLIHGGAVLQTKQPTLEPMPIKRLELGLTDLCNMNCIMCCLSWGEASPKDEPQKGMMDRALLNKLLTEISAQPVDELVVWLHWIGEPLIYPHVDELCQKIDEMGATLHLVTNGIQLTPKRQSFLLGLNGQHTINISLNALSESVFAEVNQSKAHTQVMRHTHGFLNRAVTEGRWNVVLSAVVLKENWRDVIKMVAYWSQCIERLGAVPSIVVNGKPDSNRQITPYQIALLREVAEPDAWVYFRFVLRACLPNVEGWALGFWEGFDQALLEKEATQVVYCLEKLADEKLSEANQIIQSVAKNDPIFAGELVAQGDVELISHLLEPLCLSHRQFDHPILPFDWSRLAPIDCLRMGLSFLSVRKEAFEQISHPDLWSKTLRLTLAKWLLFEPSLDPNLVPILEPTTLLSDLLIAFWQDKPLLHIPEVNDSYWLEGFAAQISIRDRPVWKVQVMKQPLPTLSARLLESIDPQHHPECFVLQKEIPETPSWLWRAFRRRIIFAGFVETLHVAQRECQLNNPSEWERWLISLCGGASLDLGVVWSGGVYSETAYSDLADVMAQLEVGHDVKKGLAYGAQQILLCPMLSLSAEQEFGLIRLWAMCDGQGDWDVYVHQLMGSDLQPWQNQMLQKLLPA